MASHDKTYTYCPLNKYKEPPFKVYLHHLIIGDWSIGLYSHPKRFISINLKERYLVFTWIGPN